MHLNVPDLLKKIFSFLSGSDGKINFALANKLLQGIHMNSIEKLKLKGSELSRLISCSNSSVQQNTLFSYNIIKFINSCVSLKNLTFYDFNVVTHKQYLKQLISYYK